MPIPTKNTLLLFLLIGMRSALSAQELLNFEKLTEILTTTTVRQTDSLLHILQWDSLDQQSQLSTLLGTRIYERGELRIYEYLQRNPQKYYQIGSFRNHIYSIYAYPVSHQKDAKLERFYQEVWLKIAHAELPNIEDKFFLKYTMSDEVFRAYYVLLGVDTEDIYGWDCEQEGFFQIRQRMAILTLISLLDLVDLKKICLLLLDYPLMETQMYAVEALLYLDYTSKKNKGNPIFRDHRDLLKALKLNRQEIREIKAIKAAACKVRTCTYRSTESSPYSTTKELLSKKELRHSFHNYDSYIFPPKDFLKEREKIGL
ncbi:MAG: hypothetical protein AAFY71_02355 [Bacteroidota bacterium]